MVAWHHLQLHPLKRTDDHVGDVIAMDEYIGERRVRMRAVAIEVVPRRRLVWQLRKVITLPVRLSLDLTDDESGVASPTRSRRDSRARQASGPAHGLYFSRKFAAAMDDHVKTEFPLLQDRLPQVKPEMGAR